MPALGIIPDQLRCNDYTDMNTCVGFDGSNKSDGLSQDGPMLGRRDSTNDSIINPWVSVESVSVWDQPRNGPLLWKRREITSGDMSEGDQQP
jgi:hypothetical protein